MMHLIKRAVGLMTKVLLSLVLVMHLLRITSRYSQSLPNTVLSAQGEDSMTDRANSSCKSKIEYTEYFLNTTHYDLVTTLQSILSSSNEHIKKIQGETGVYAPGKKDLLDQENPFFRVYLSKQPFYWIFLIIFVITVINYGILFVFSFKKCPPKCLRRNMAVRPWSDFEKDTPAKVVMASSLLTIYLCYLLLTSLSSLHTDYSTSKCVLNNFVIQTSYGFDNKIIAASNTRMKPQYFYGYDNIKDQIKIIQHTYGENNQKLMNAAFTDVSFVKAKINDTYDLLNSYVEEFKSEQVLSPGGTHAKVPKVQPAQLYRLGTVETLDSTTYLINNDYKQSTYELGFYMINITDTASSLNTKQTTYQKQLSDYYSTLVSLSQQNNDLADELDNKLFRELNFLHETCLPSLQVALIILIPLNLLIAYAVFWIYFRKKHKFIQVLNLIWVIIGAFLLPTAVLATFGFTSFMFVQDMCQEFKGMIDNPALFQNTVLFPPELRYTISQCMSRPEERAELNEINFVHEYLTDVYNFQQGQNNFTIKRERIQTAKDYYEKITPETNSILKDMYMQNITQQGFNTSYYHKLLDHQHDIQSVLDDYSLATSNADKVETNYEWAANMLFRMNSYTLLDNPPENSCQQKEACTGGLVANDLFTTKVINETNCIYGDDIIVTFNPYQKGNSMPSISPTAANCFRINVFDNTEMQARYQSESAMKTYDRNCQGNDYKDIFLDMQGITNIILEYHKGLYLFANSVETLFQMVKGKYDQIVSTSNQYNQDIEAKFDIIKQSTSEYYQNIIDSMEKVREKTNCAFIRPRIISAYQQFCVTYTTGMYTFLFRVWLMQLVLYAQVTMTFTALYRIKNFVVPGESIRIQMEKQRRREAKALRRQEKEYKRKYAHLKKCLQQANQDKLEYEQHHKSMQALKHELKYSNFTRNALKNITREEDPEAFLHKKVEKKSDESSSLGSYDVNEEVNYQAKDIFSISSDENDADAREIAAFKAKIGRPGQ